MIEKIKKYFVESYYELKKVNWPTKNETINLTVIVVLISLFVAVFLGLIDILATYVIENIIL